MVIMMHELSWDAFMDPDDRGHSEVKHYAVLKGLTGLAAGGATLVKYQGLFVNKSTKL